MARVQDGAWTLGLRSPLRAGTLTPVSIDGQESLSSLYERAAEALQTHPLTITLLLHDQTLNNTESICCDAAGLRDGAEISVMHQKCFLQVQLAACNVVNVMNYGCGQLIGTIPLPNHTRTDHIILNGVNLLYAGWVDDDSWVVEVWDVTKLRRIKRLHHIRDADKRDDHEIDDFHFIDDVICAVVSDAAAFAALAGEDKIKVWSFQSFGCLLTLNNVGGWGSFHFSPDEGLFIVDLPTHPGPGESHVLKAWQTCTWEVLFCICGPMFMMQVTISSDSQFFATGGDSLRLWSSRSGDCLHIFTDVSLDTNHVKESTFISDSTVLAAIIECKVKLFDVASFAHMGCLSCPFKSCRFSSLSKVTGAVAICTSYEIESEDFPRSPLLFNGKHVQHIWDVHTRTILRSVLSNSKWPAGICLPTKKIPAVEGVEKKARQQIAGASKQQ